MIGTFPEMRASMHDLTVSLWSLAAIGVLFESGLAQHLREPRAVDELASLCGGLGRDRVEHTLRVAAAVGVVVENGGLYKLAEGALSFANEPLATTLRGEIRTHLMQTLAFLDSAKGAAPATGWRHVDPALLQSQGDASAAVPVMLKTNLAAAMGDLAERLGRPGARFLDVGVGVASLAITMCRVWPQVSVVGLDVFDAPLAMARGNVARAGLDNRIELRQKAVEALEDKASFDLAWLPGFFIAEGALSQALERIFQSLKPGGWVLFPQLGGAGTARERSVAALITDLWGGAALGSAAVEGLLANAGFSSVRAIPGPAWAPAMFVGQRA